MVNYDFYRKYEKNKLRLNEIASAMQGFYFLVKFGLVLIYLLKVYCKKSSSILLRKNMFNWLLSFEKHVPSTPSIFLSKFSSEIYLSRIINYWGSIFTLYLTWGAFSLVCVLSVFFFLSFFIGFFFCRYFSGQTLTIDRIAGKGEEVLIFLVFHFHPLTNII